MIMLYHDIEVERDGDDRSLLISDGTRFVPKDFYPKFSWDTTPRYFMFGDKNRVLSPEQVRFIAEQTDFLCIEKSHGMEQLGAAELGAKHEAAAFKHWERPEFSYNTDAHYFGKELSRTERPHILWKDGKPEYLFLANHGSREAGFYLKIENWK